jgi:uncharacterized protein YdhG (YjbR/CyaY superfamily)
MAEKKPAQGFSDEEKAAMQERARELAEGTGKTVQGEGAVMAKIAEMPEPDKTLAKRVHEIVMAAAPGLKPRTWYGFPAYANKDGKVVWFFHGAARFKERYSTLGFNTAANLDEGNMWPTSWALKEITPAEEARIAALVKKAVG